jgi:hypothetical protein
LFLDGPVLILGMFRDQLFENENTFLRKVSLSVNLNLSFLSVNSLHQSILRLHIIIFRNGILISIFDQMVTQCNLVVKSVFLFGQLHVNESQDNSSDRDGKVYVILVQTFLGSISCCHLCQHKSEGCLPDD